CPLELPAVPPTPRPSIRRRRRLNEGGARSPLDPPTDQAQLAVRLELPVQLLAQAGELGCGLQRLQPPLRNPSFAVPRAEQRAGDRAVGVRVATAGDARTIRGTASAAEYGGDYFESRAWRKADSTNSSRSFPQKLRS